MIDEKRNVAARMLYFQTAWNSLASMKMWDAIDYMENLDVMDEKNSKGVTVRDLCKECKRLYTNKEDMMQKKYVSLKSFFLDFQDDVDDEMHSFVEKLNYQVFLLMKENNYQEAEEKSIAMTAFILLDAAKEYFKGVMAKAKQNCKKDFSKEYHMYNIYSTCEKFWEVVSIFIKSDIGIDYKANDACFNAFVDLEKHLVNGERMKEIVAKTAMRNEECLKYHPEIINKIKTWKDV